MRWSETLGHQMPADYSPPDRYPAIRLRLGGNRMQFNQSDGASSSRCSAARRRGRSRRARSNPAAPAVKREAEEDWGKQKWR